MGQALFGAPAKAYSTSTASPEHTIYGASAFTPTLTAYSDGTPDITLATAFYRTGATTGWRVKGGRVYIPSGTTGLPGTMTVTFRKTANAVGVDLSTTALQTKVISVVVGGWCEARFDTPQAIAAGTSEIAWIAYTFGDAHYLHGPLVVTDAVQASDGSSIYLSNAGDAGGESSRFRLGTGSTLVPATPAGYGIDIIFDEG